MAYKKKDYVQSDTVTQAQQALEAHKGRKPGDYQSQWKGAMDDLMKQYQDRDPFQYDQSKDTMYQQAAQQYVRQGRKAMMDTIGQASALTGGYGNSYAQTVGQHAYGEYLQRIGDLAPKYHQMALDRYRAQGDDILKRFGMLSKREEDAYSRYLSQLHLHNSELDRLQGAYEREKDRDYGHYVNQQNFEFQLDKDQREAQHRADREAAEEKRYQEQWQHQLDREAKEQQEAARKDLLYLMQNNYRPNADEIKAAGMTQAQIDALWNTMHPAPVPVYYDSSDDSGGGGYTGGGGDTRTEAQKIADQYFEAQHNKAPHRELDAWLKQEVSQGNISADDVAELRNAHGKDDFHPSWQKRR